MSTRLDIELQALITERDGMNAENETREHGSNAPAYGMDHYQELASRMRDLIERYADNGPGDTERVSYKGSTTASHAEGPGSSPGARSTSRPTREEVEEAYVLIHDAFIEWCRWMPFHEDRGRNATGDVTQIALVANAIDVFGAVLRRAVEPRPAPLAKEIEGALATIEHNLAAYERRFGEDDHDTRAALSVLLRALGVEVE